MCCDCWLVQTQDFLSSEDIFKQDYHIFLAPLNLAGTCKQFCDQISKTLKLDENSFVVEIASNDGYLLQKFKDKRILGIEPTSSTRMLQKRKVWTHS